MTFRLPEPAGRALATLIGLTAFTCGAAGAGEISLFEGRGFSGHVVSLRNITPSVSAIGFNDRTSSIVVRSGRWEVCSDDNFKGDCAIFEPGQYATLDGRFDKQVSSTREVAAVAAATTPGAAEAPGIGTVELFDEPDFRGRTVRLDRDASNFGNLNFNDRASSVVVRGGPWEMCTDAGFHGACRTFAPGRYPSLGYGMGRSISSARPAMDRQAPEVVHGGGWNRRERDDAAGRPIVLFSGDGIRGRSIAIAGDMADLSKANFNDLAQSVVIEDGYWEFCSDSYYRGTCRVLGPGAYQRLEPELYRSVSSIRAASRDPRAATGRADVELFTGNNFTGRRFPVGQDMATFSDGGFNDEISSVIVNNGQWQMCVDADYRGSCTVFGPGRYPGLGGLAKQLSSIRRVD